MPVTGDAAAIKLALDAWANHMKATRQPVPDFWDEYCASESISEWLAFAGFRITALARDAEGR